MLVAKILLILVISINFDNYTNIMATGTRSKKMSSAISRAAKAGDAEELRRLISTGASVRIPDDEGWYPLHQAAAAGHIDCLKILLNHEHTDVDWKTSKGETAIYLAAKGGHAECLQMLIKANGDFNIQKTSNGATALYEATKGGHKQCVAYLIEGGADPCLNKFRMRRPLYVAAGMKDRLEILKILLPAAEQEFIFDIDRAERLLHQNWTTPLHYAIRYNNTEAAKLILDHGIDINTGCIYSKKLSDMPTITLSPLNFAYKIACLFKDTDMEMFRFLLSRGAVLRCEAGSCYVKLKESSYWPHIRKFIEKPAPLQHLCRLAVREILRPKGLHRMKEFVSNMDITDIMKSYLLYEDYLTDLILKKELPQIKE